MNQPTIIQFERFDTDKAGWETLFNNRKSSIKIQRTHKVKDTAQAHIHRNKEIF